MYDSWIIFTFCIFIITIFFIMWRPRGINEAIPTTIGSMLIIFTGIVSVHEVHQILGIVSGPAITIISTIVMCVVLESIGIFKWAAFNVIQKANGSGIKLFWYILLLCFLITLFFNNDGSILITTPIIIHIITILKIPHHQKLPYLFGGVFVATASSLPIGVSNIANLIGLRVVDLDLNLYTSMVFVPSMLGIISLNFLLFLYFYKDLPRNISKFDHNLFHTIMTEKKRYHHPLANKKAEVIDWSLCRICLTIVILTRISYFIFPAFGLRMEWIAIIGALLLIGVRWSKKRIGANDVLIKAPWHILVFAFGMYVLVYALNNTGVTSSVINLIEGPVSSNLLSASFIMGTLISFLSNLMNNLPSVMLGTMMITSMSIDQLTLQMSYIAVVVGSDIGALLTPLGTLATLLWMFVLRKEGIVVTWSQYFKVAIMVIPSTLIIILATLYLWNLFLFF